MGIIVAAIRGIEVVDLSICRSTTKSNHLSIEAYVHVNIMVSWLKHEYVSVITPLTMIARVMTTLLMPNTIDNTLGIVLTWCKNFNSLGVPIRWVRFCTKQTLVFSSNSNCHNQ